MPSAKTDHLKYRNCCPSESSNACGYRSARFDIITMPSDVLVTIAPSSSTSTFLQYWCDTRDMSTPEAAQISSRIATQRPSVQASTSELFMSSALCARFVLNRWCMYDPIVSSEGAQCSFLSSRSTDGGPYF